MNELINISAVLLVLAVMGAQGYMFGSLMMGKLIEYYDVLYGNKLYASEFLEKIGCCKPYDSAGRVIKDFNEFSKSWERG